MCCFKFTKFCSIQRSLQLSWKLNQKTLWQEETPDDFDSSWGHGLLKELLGQSSKCRRSLPQSCEFFNGRNVVIYVRSLYNTVWLDQSSCSINVCWINSLSREALFSIVVQHHCLGSSSHTNPTKVVILKYLHFCSIPFVFSMCDIDSLDRKGKHVKLIINLFS